MCRDSRASSQPARLNRLYSRRYAPLNHFNRLGHESKLSHLSPQSTCSRLRRSTDSIDSGLASKLAARSSQSSVPEKRLELSRPCGHRNLNPACLPIPPLRRNPKRGSGPSLQVQQPQVAPESVDMAGCADVVLSELNRAFALIVHVDQESRT